MSRGPDGPARSGGTIRPQRPIELPTVGSTRRPTNLTLVDLHYALQSAFDWDDDHLYAFWLDGRFWTSTDECFTRPRAAGDTLGGSSGRSAAIALDRLGLAQGRQIAYVFDFGDEWRVRLRVRQVLAADGDPSPRLLASVGAAPPQYIHAA